jgi:hypothetical protein
VLHHAILIEDLIEDLQRPSAVNHEIFRDDLEPVHHRLLLKNMAVVRDTQANSDAIVCVSVKSIRRHKLFDKWLEEVLEKAEDQAIVWLALPGMRGQLGLWHRVLRIGGALAFALAIVGAFGATAATLAFAGVLAFTSMLFFLGFAGLFAAGFCGVLAGILCDHSLTSNETCQRCAHH